MDLIFEESIGRTPDSESLEAEILRACSVEDLDLWDELCLIPMDELERAVANLRRMGWRFHLTEVH